jgi:hypothetical protein
LPGRLELSGSSVDLGATSSLGTVTLTNNGQQPLDWTITSKRSPGPFSVAPTSGQLQPGASVQVQISIDRSRHLEKDPRATFNVKSSVKGCGELSVRAAVDVDPLVDLTGLLP